MLAHFPYNCMIVVGMRVGVAVDGWPEGTREHRKDQRCISSRVCQVL